MKPSRDNLFLGNHSLELYIVSTFQNRWNLVGISPQWSCPPFCSTSAPGNVLITWDSHRCVADQSFCPYPLSPLVSMLCSPPLIVSVTGSFDSGLCNVAMVSKQMCEKSLVYYVLPPFWFSVHQGSSVPSVRVSMSGRHPWGRDHVHLWNSGKRVLFPHAAVSSLCYAGLPILKVKLHR